MGTLKYGIYTKCVTSVIYIFLVFNIIFIQSSSALDSDMQPVVFEDSAELVPAWSIFYYNVKLANNTATSTSSDVNLTVTIPIGFEYNSTNLSECSLLQVMVMSL